MKTVTLKVDLHMHSGGDPQDYLRYSPEKLIDKVASLGYDAIAIANHDCAIYCPRLADYARGKGVLLIPGIELTYKRQHIVLINFEDPSEIQNPDDILSRKCPENLVIASHPYYPLAKSCGPLLDARPELFDAVEYSFMYVPGINFNKRAVRRAQKLGLPVVANSDAHGFDHLDYNYTLVDAEEKTPESIIAAIKAGRCRVVSRPMSYPAFFWMIVTMKIEDAIRRASEKAKRMMGKNR